MGRILGRVEYGEGEAPRYFIHCDTAVSSFTPLFADDQAAWRAYDSGGSAALYAAVPAVSTTVRVVRKTLAFGRQFGNEGQQYDRVLFGLATADRLLMPIEQYGGRCYTLLRHGNVLHVAEYGDAGFSGVSDEPICDERWRSTDADETFSFAEFYGKPLPLCIHCTAILLGKMQAEG
ncbi:hypothetical protein [Burkholderia aenigmatica]|uniref:hypothetical protein n=1 Tax=Burkholderia aenigmatica TaxID=2015348 RepID=UPI00264C2DD7|nr:hypothetical protein [Burkholderia aenigmatica]MDN7880147.1 hypothetical protein [Burkholderia aenigmatica]